MRFGYWMICVLMAAFPKVHASDSAQALTPSEHNPLYLLLLTPTWQSVGRLSQGDTSLGFQSHYTNIFERRISDRYFQDFDGEMGSIHLYVHHAITQRLGIRLDMGAHRYNGGFLDSSIQSFHHTFGFANDDRDLVLDDRRIMRLQTQDGDILFDLAPQEWHQDNPQLALAWHLRTAGQWAFSLGTTIKIPLGSGQLHNEHLDVSLDFHGRFQGLRWRFDFQAGLLTLSPPEKLDPLTQDGAAYAMIWLERIWRQKWRTFLEVDATSAYFKNTGLDTLDLEPVNLTLGLSLDFAKSWSMNLTFGEDITAQGPALDFHINWGVAVRL